MPPVLVLHPRIAVAGQHPAPGRARVTGKLQYIPGRLVRIDRLRIGSAWTRRRIAAALGGQLQRGRVLAAEPDLGLGAEQPGLADDGEDARSSPAGELLVADSKSCWECSSPAMKIRPPPSCRRSSSASRATAGQGPACRVDQQHGVVSPSSASDVRQPVIGRSPGWRKPGSACCIQAAKSTCWSRWSALRRNWTSGDGAPAINSTRICWRTTRTAAVATLSSWVSSGPASSIRPGTRTGRPPWARSGT